MVSKVGGQFNQSDYGGDSGRAYEDARDNLQSGEGKRRGAGFPGGVDNGQGVGFHGFSGFTITCGRGCIPRDTRAAESIKTLSQ